MMSGFDNPNFIPAFHSGRRMGKTHAMEMQIAKARAEGRTVLVIKRKPGTKPTQHNFHTGDDWIRYFIELPIRRPDYWLRKIYDEWKEAQQPNPHIKWFDFPDNS